MNKVVPTYFVFVTVIIVLAASHLVTGSRRRPVRSVLATAGRTVEIIMYVEIYIDGLVTVLI